MSGLILKLAPKERVLVNGAVVENGDRRCRLSILTPDAKILRLRDAIHPDQVTTPVRRVCYTLQLILSGDAVFEDLQLQILQQIESLSRVFVDIDSRAIIGTATEALLDRQSYKCLKEMRKLLSREDRFLARVGKHGVI